MKCFYKIIIHSSLRGSVEYAYKSFIEKDFNRLHYGECTPGQYYKVLIGNKLNDLVAILDECIKKHCNETIVKDRDYNSVINYEAPTVLELFIHVQQVDTSEIAVEDFKKLPVNEFEDYLKNLKDNYDRTDPVLLFDWM